MKTLFDRLGRLLGGTAADEDASDPRALHLAAAVLLFEVAKADHRLEQAERDRLRQVLRDYWGLDDAALAELVEVAEQESDTNASLYRQLDLLNEQLSAEQKFQLMKGLWLVACADGQIHHYEEHLVRRLADLLYVPHSEFIRAKHLALDRS